jgi:hypothetical protein
MKNIIIFSILLLNFSISYCQPLSNGKKEEKTMLSGVTGEATYILRQDYYLIDTTVSAPKKLGYNNNPYFGRFYFVAIVADGKFYTDKHINTPWLLDSVYAAIIAENRNYKPVLGNLAWKSISAQSFRDIDSIVNYNKVRDSSVTSNYPCAILTAPASLAGLQIDTIKQNPSDSTVWFWVAKSKNAQTAKGNVFIDTVPSVDFDAFKGKFNFVKGDYTTGNQFYSTKTLGGYIFITRASLGKLSFYLHGVIVKNREGKYIMHPIPKESLSLVSTPSLPPPPADKKENSAINKINEIKEQR